jgi:Ser/Thr protein kinase RdoA (MazF antagonist)
LDICDVLNQHEAELRKQYIITDGQLYFHKLKGGICNAPVYVYQKQNGIEKPTFVIKQESENYDFANARFSALDNMTARGFRFNPQIFCNCDGDYLTKLGDDYYSAIEYIPSDPAHQEKDVGFVDMLKLTACFHQYSQGVAYHPALDQSRYALHMSRQNIIDEVDRFQIGKDFFKSKKFQRVRVLYKFYETQAAVEMFDRLPKQFIHGDNHQYNLIFHNGEAFYIDLDARRYDVRLYDFSSCIQHGSARVKQDYLELVRKDELFSTIDLHYGNLTPEEKESFHLILAFSYIEFFSWAMGRIKHDLTSGQRVEAENLLSLMIERTDELLQLMDLGLIDEAQIHDAISARCNCAVV